MVPIRVELETETHRIRDAFVWNLNEELISPAAFARIFCNDIGVSQDYAEQVEGAIRSQIEEWEGVASMDLRPPLHQPPPIQDPAPFYSITNEDPGQPKIEEWELPYIDRRPNSNTTSFRSHRMGSLISFDAGILRSYSLFRLGRHKRDAVEWNVISAGETTAVDPEEEREKPRDRSGMSLLKDKTGLGMGIGFGKRGEGRGPRSLKGVFRDWSDMEEWGTKLEELTAEEVERREIERERAARRLRRETSRFQQTTTVRSRRR